MVKVNVVKETYKNFGNCIKISNDFCQLFVTVDFGPRIINYSLKGKTNVLNENGTATMQIGDEQWRLIGGHRLWHSPEASPRTYIPDNAPVSYEIIENGVKLSQETEKLANMKKEYEIVMDENSTKVKLTHKIINKNIWPVEYSAWTITVMDKGGQAIIPMVKKETGFLPNSLISIWPYTKMNDSRFKWGEYFTIINQDVAANNSLKIGLNNENQWAAYYVNENVFVKKFQCIADEKYPDFGVCFECFTDKDVLELEALSPMKQVEPDGCIIHEEQWQLFENKELNTEDELELQEYFKQIL